MTQSASESETLAPEVLDDFVKRYKAVRTVENFVSLQAFQDIFLKQMTSTQNEATKKPEGIRINRSVYQEANCKLKLLSERFWGTFKRSHKYWKNYDKKI